MKKLSLTFLCVIAIIIIFTCRQAVTKGVIEGIQLNLYSVIPSLLPFMLITNIMIRYDLCRDISFFFHPIISKIFKVSQNGCFAVIIGFACGYPMGAKTVGDLYRENRINHKEACYLITFCNNSSITFLLNYILYMCLNQRIRTSTLIFLVYFPAVIAGFINKFIFRPDTKNLMESKLSSDTKNPIFNTIKSISALSIYVITFSIISQCIATLKFIPYSIQKIIMCFNEITSGADFVCANNYVIPQDLFLVILGCVFGGFSIMFQSFSQLPTSGLKLCYVLGKIETMLLYSLLFFGLLFMEKLF